MLYIPQPLGIKGDAMHHYIPSQSALTALEKFATASRRLAGVSDLNKWEHHHNATRLTASHALFTLGQDTDTARKAVLTAGEKVGTAGGKFAVVRRGNAYEKALAHLADAKAFEDAFRKANQFALAPLAPFGKVEHLPAPRKGEELSANRFAKLL